MKNKESLERIAQTLTVVSFVVICWLVHRAVQVRTDCVTSSYISFVQINGQRISNCLFESRLSLRNWFRRVPSEHQEIARSLEVLEPLNSLLGEPQVQLAVDVNVRHPRLFELGKGYVRLGTEWLKDRMQTRRALVMGILRERFPQSYLNQFQLEVTTDFIMLTIFSDHEWRGSDGQSVSQITDLGFRTAAPSLKEYCASPFMSLSHAGVCGLEEGEFSLAWGMRPLLAAAMWRVYDHLSLPRKLRIVESLRAGKTPDPVPELTSLEAANLVVWLQAALTRQMAALLPESEETSQAIRRSLTELEVEAPTRWELTLDVTNTPAWREIVAQMRERSRLMRRERILIFTPEGATALPADRAVNWAGNEVSTQKHVLIACRWPKPEDTVHVKARHLFAQQSCSKLEQAFWELAPTVN